ncbi:hypothetical protein [Methylobacter luteus]|uniref:hypothetical protein n=1 Tax=Methylobacter luteus TaxID=415 RepID=UPI000481579F|nr:hypothetical protein [Methylobacter luteus]
MSAKHIQGVGAFHQGPDYWESEPEALHGATLSIEADAISHEAEVRAKIICDEWQNFLQTSISFIEQNREKYQLCAKEFSNPNVFIESGTTWSIYFDMELEHESVIGVEFSANEPFQLIIGD